MVTSPATFICSARSLRLENSKIAVDGLRRFNRVDTGQELALVGKIVLHAIPKLQCIALPLPLHSMRRVTSSHGMVRNYRPLRHREFDHFHRHSSSPRPKCCWSSPCMAWEFAASAMPKIRAQILPCTALDLQKAWEGMVEKRDSWGWNFPTGFMFGKAAKVKLFHSSPHSFFRFKSRVSDEIWVADDPIEGEVKQRSNQALLWCTYGASLGSPGWYNII